MGEGLGSFLPPLVARLTADISEFSSKMGEAVGEAKTAEKESSSSFNKLATVGKAAFLGLGTAAIGLGVEAVHLADKWEVSHAQMTTAIKNAGQSMGPWQAQISATEKKMANLGFTNADVEGSLATMIRGTGSVSKSLQMQALAANIARAQNIPLAAASLLVTKSYEGNSRALKSLGINQNVAAGSARNIVTSSRAAKTAQMDYNDALANYNAKGGKTVANEQALQKAHRSLALAQKNLNDAQTAGGKIIDVLSKKMGGQASAYANTFSGRLQVLKAKSEDLGKNFGLVLVPKLEDVIDATMAVIGWFQKHSTVAKILAGVIGGVLVVAIGAYITKLAIAAAQSVANFAKMMAAGAAWAAEQLSTLASVAAEWATTMIEMASEAMVWAAGMLAAGAEALLPFAPIILVVAALAAAGYELYEHWGQIWGFIKKLTSDAVDFVKSHLALIVTVALGPIGLAALELYRHWDTVWNDIKSITSTAVNWVRSHLLLIGAIALGPIGVAALLLYKNWGTVWNGIQSVIQSVWSVIKPIFDEIEAAAGKVSGAIGKIAGVAGKVGGVISHIPGFAEGTNSAPGGRAIVGEKGPELVDLPRGSKVHTASKTKKLIARYTPKVKPSPIMDSAFQGVSDGLTTALVKGMNHGNHKAVEHARRDAEKLARSTIVGTGKHAHHLSGAQQSKAITELMKASEKTHREDVKQRIADAKDRKQKRLDPRLTKLGNAQTAYETRLSAQTAAATAKSLGVGTAKASLITAQQREASARALVKATKGLADHKQAIDALKKATTDATQARKNDLSALKQAAIAREYKVGQALQYSSNGGSFLGAAAASAHASGDLVLAVDGRELFRVTQKQALKKNGRNPTNGLSTVR